MKNIINAIFICLFIIFVSCKNNSDPVTYSGNPPVIGWVLDYRDYNIGTLFCNMPDPCSMDIITDSINLVNCDSIRVYMSYYSIRNNNLTITKYPNYLDLYTCSFPDSSRGILDKTFTAFNYKIILDFAFEIETRFTIDTLQIFKKIR